MAVPDTATVLDAAKKMPEARPGMMRNMWNGWVSTCPKIIGNTGH